MTDNYLYDKLAGQWILVKIVTYGSWTKTLHTTKLLENGTVETVIFDTDSTYKWQTCSAEDYPCIDDSNFVTYAYTIYWKDYGQGGHYDFISSDKLSGKIAIYGDSMEISPVTYDVSSTRYFIRIQPGWIPESLRY